MRKILFIFCAVAFIFTASGSFTSLHSMEEKETTLSLEKTLKKIELLLKKLDVKLCTGWKICLEKSGTFPTEEHIKFAKKHPITFAMLAASMH